jgi:hypothetical protein
VNYKELGDLLVARLRRTDLGDYVVAKFTDSANSTVDGWRRDKDPKPPRGERLNRLWHLLHFAGVDSPELQELPEFGRYLGELMAFSVISIEDARRICGGVGEKAVLDTIRGTGQPAKPQYTVEQLKEKYGDSLQQKKEEWRTNVRVLPALSASKLTTQLQPTLPAPAAAHVSNPFILDLAIRLSALLPLLNYANSDVVSPKERDQLRQLLGQDGMFAIATAFQALNSERVRTSLQQGR